MGLEAARVLEPEFGDRIEFRESSVAGLRLLDVLEGCDRALLVDAVKSGAHPAGTVTEYSPSELKRVLAPSPHYSGVPEVFSLAERLKVRFPSDIRILTMEVEDPYNFEVGLTPSVRAALPEFVERARGILRSWVC